MTFLFESPLPFLLIGILFVAVLAAAWSQTGRRWAFLAMLAAVLLTVGLLFLEYAVVTPREHVTQTLHTIADLVEQNEVDQALQYVHSGAAAVRDRAAAEMPRYEFSRVSIKPNLEVTFPDETNPTEATATFNAVVVLGSGAFADRSIPRYVTVTFRKENGKWRVYDYQHTDPRQGFMDLDF